jgi:hypothetical protein
MTTYDEDRFVLEHWSFVKDFASHEEPLVELATLAYEFAKLTFRTDRPDEVACVAMYETCLTHSDLFERILKRKQHMPVALRHGMRQRMARYVVHRRWDVIST